MQIGIVLRSTLNSKDYSIVKMLGFNEVDPTKWKQEEKTSYIIWESKRSLENMKEGAKFGKYYQTHLKDHLTKESLRFDEFNKKIARLNEINKQISEMTDKQLHSASGKNIILVKHKLLSDIEADFIESEPIMNHWINSLNSVKDYEVVFLNENAIFLFYLFIKIIIFRIIFFRSDSSKQILSSISPTIFRVINEIQIQLSEFLRTSKIGFSEPNPLDNIAFYFGRTRELEIKPYYLQQYQVLGMKTEIKSVLNSLLQLNEEIKSYNIMDVDLIKEQIDDIRIYRINDETKKLLKSIKQLKNIIETEINSPQYQRHDKMVMETAENLLQLIPISKR